MSQAVDHTNHPATAPHADPDLWSAALMRMRKFNARHAIIAVDLRNGPDRLGPYATGLLYRTRAASRGLVDVPTAALHQTALRDPAEVAAATRLFRDGPDVQDLPQMLAALSDAAQQRLTQDGPYDPMELVHRQPADLPAGAQLELVGLGVSGLNSSAGGWAEVSGQQGLTALQVRGRSLVLLHDGTCLMLDRGGDLGSRGRMWSTVALGPQMSLTGDTYQPFHLTDENGPTWSAMHRYLSVVTEVHAGWAQLRARRSRAWTVPSPRRRVVSDDGNRALHRVRV